MGNDLNLLGDTESDDLNTEDMLMMLQAPI